VHAVAGTTASSLNQRTGLAPVYRLPAVRRLLRTSIAVLFVAAVGFAPAPALAGPVLPLGHAGRWITDARGRVVIVHGINMVYKLAPFYPSAVGFDDDDAAFLQRIGFNAVRVGVLWEAVEPSPGVYDTGYLNHIADTVTTLARHGIVSLLDFHQDQYNERFEGEGFPTWSVQDDGLPNQPKTGFGNDYLVMPGLNAAFNNFWANSPGPGGVGLQDRYAAAWRTVASRFAANSDVLGYEIMNEPWPGTQWPTCTQPAGCPVFDQQSLNPFYHRVLTAIRTVDHRTLVWYEPNVIFNNGADTYAGPLGDAQAGFAFHDYCLIEPDTGTPAGCGIPDDLVFGNAVKHVAGTGEAVMETEFGATDDTAYLTDMVQRADRFMVPWLEWAYCGCGDPTTSGPGDKQAIVRDPSKPPTGANLVEPTLHALVEPYPQVVAGTPASWGFNPSTRVFSLRFSTSRAGASASAARFATGSVTEIATPALVYAGRYGARVSGGAVVSKPGASVLQVAQCPGASSISVTVTPSGRSHGSCTAAALRPAAKRRTPRPKRSQPAPAFTG
jgi:endoglycosylceramidase